MLTHYHYIWRLNGDFDDQQAGLARRGWSLLSALIMLSVLSSCGDYRSEETCGESIPRGDKGRFECQ